MESIEPSSDEKQAHTLEWAYGVSLNAVLAQENDKSDSAKALNAPAPPTLADS